MSAVPFAGRESFAGALRGQVRVIWALLMREIISRYGRANLGFAWLFLEPMLFTLGVTALWTAWGMSRAHGLPIVAFALTGYSTVLLWRNSVSRASGAISGNVGLLYHRNVRVLDLMLTRIWLEIVGASVSFVVLGVFWISIGWCDAPYNILQVLAAWALLAWFATSLGVLIGALTSFNDLFERLWTPCTYVLFPLSGALFMTDWLPRPMREAVLWIPMVHGVEFLREGFFGPVVQMHYDLTYLVGVTLVLNLLGLVMVKDAAKRIRFR